MGQIEVNAERTVNAPADKVYGYIRDMRDHHPNFLPPQFTDFQVESGGVGAGTVVSFTVNAGGRHRAVRDTINEPEPGRVLTETDQNSSMVTTYTVTPKENAASAVRVHTTWQGAGGIGGFFERTFAPRALKSIYDDLLDRLNAYAQTRDS